MAKIEVNPGICGLKTKLDINADKKKTFNVEIDSECPHIRAMAGELKDLNGYKECFAKYSQSTVFQVAEKHCRHLACPVPTAIIKGAEVACGLAIPKDFSCSFE